MSLSVRSATRRLVVLTALRWLPNGLAVPVTVLLASARGLSVAEIGVVFLVHGVVVTVLELPTGGLADAIGRRPVLAASAVLKLSGLLAFAAAGDLPAFCLAMGLVAAGRALDSGPLEAWYVDAVHLVEPDADVTPGLSRAGVADGLALAVGAVVGGLLPALIDSSSALAVPLVLAAVLELVHLVALLALVTPLGPPREGAALAALRQGTAQVPRVVRTTVQLAARDSTLRLLLALAFAMGLVLYTLELLGPLHFAELAGGRTEGTAVFGLVVAASFAAAAAGSALAVPARRALRDSARLTIAGTLVAGAALIAVLAGSASLVLAAVAYCAFFLANGVSWPLRRQLLHARVDASVRSTTLSAWSLCLQLGGIGGALVIPQLAERAGNRAAFGAAAVVLVVACAVALRLPRVAPRDLVGRTSGCR